MTDPSAFHAAIALATVSELPAGIRSRPDAERPASRLAARRAIRRLAGQSAEIEIRRRPNRPPLARFRRPGGVPQSVTLALSHRDGCAAAIATSHAVRIGIDLERLDAVPAGAERMFMTPIERTRVTESLTSAIVWSLKEASWKALQLGPGVSFHDLELDIDEGRGLRAVLLRGVWLPASATIALPWPGFVLTIVRVERRP